MPNKRMLEAIRGFFQDQDEFDERSKTDLDTWLVWLESVPDSTAACQYYAIFSSLLDYYIAQIRGLLDEAEEHRDAIKGQARRDLSRTQTKQITEGQVMMACHERTEYTAASEMVRRRTRIVRTLQGLKNGVDKDVVGQYANNQRAEMRD